LVPDTVSHVSESTVALVQRATASRCRAAWLFCRVGLLPPSLVCSLLCWLSVRLCSTLSRVHGSITHGGYRRPSDSF
ncbi:hypothetical protein CLOM_g22578, partial [Closterium sp. NIES-68]